MKTKALRDIQPGERFKLLRETFWNKCTSVTSFGGAVTKINYVSWSGRRGSLEYGLDHAVQYEPLPTIRKRAGEAQPGDIMVGPMSGSHYKFVKRIVENNVTTHVEFKTVVGGTNFTYPAHYFLDFLDTSTQQKEKPMTKPKAKTTTFLASLKVGDKFRFLKGKPENNYTVLYTDTKGTLYRSNLYPSDTFFVSTTDSREVTTKLTASRTEIIPLVNQIVDLLRQEKDLLLKLQAMGGSMDTIMDFNDNNFSVEAADASGKPIKVTL